MMKEVYKFYREHLFPIEPPPSFRNVLMWALQKGGFVLSWQFAFEKQANWAAAEAIWALMVAPEKCSGNWDVIRAAAFSSRSGEPDPGCMGSYADDAFGSLCMRASDLRDERNEEQLERLNEAESNVPPPTRAPASAAFDVGALAAHLNSVEKSDEPGDFEFEDNRNDAQQREAPGYEPYRDFDPFAPADGLPCYAEATARRQAAAESEDDDDGGLSETESEKRRARARRGVRRFLDDEAEESEDDGSDGA